MRRIVVRSGLIIIGAFIGFVCIVTIQVQRGNFHEVLPGELYRSGQLEADDIARYVKESGIRSIINLRGENMDAPWYQDELHYSKKAGVKHIDFRMKAAKELTFDQARELIEVMRKAPKPVLIHCRAGADRTGLASALYLAAIAKTSEEAAENQLSLRYGHLPYFPFFWTEAQAMYRTFERMEPSLGFTGS